MVDLHQMYHGCHTSWDVLIDVGPCAVSERRPHLVSHVYHFPLILSLDVAQRSYINASSNSAIDLVQTNALCAESMMKLTVFSRNFYYFVSVFSFPFRRLWYVRNIVGRVPPEQSAWDIPKIWWRGFRILMEPLLFRCSPSCSIVQPTK